ncbi:MAG: hypothetical protein WD960_07990 [Gemmatimonadota bacterium]
MSSGDEPEAPAQLAARELMARRGLRRRQTVVIRRTIVPDGPPGYLARGGARDEAWETFEAEHGPEAAERARHYAATGEGADVFEATTAHDGHRSVRVPEVATDPNEWAKRYRGIDPD